MQPKAERPQQTSPNVATKQQSTWQGEAVRRRIKGGMETKLTRLIREWIMADVRKDYQRAKAKYKAQQVASPSEPSDSTHEPATVTKAL